MKITSNLPRLMADKRIRSIAEVSRATGLSRITLTNIYNNKELSSIGTSTISQLCDYFNCEIGDLLELEKEG